MGGAIALSVALEKPSLVAGMVLVATGGRLRVHPAILEKTGRPETFAEAVDEITDWSYSPQAPPRLVELARERMAEIRPPVLHNDFLACDRFDVLGRLGEIRVATLVLCGRADRLTPEKYSRFLASAIPEARLEMIDSAGHMVMLERPRDVAAALQGFMAEAFG
jgi:pimeloyl-ACP methyl ester carboxylesterase